MILAFLAKLSKKKVPVYSKHGKKYTIRFFKTKINQKKVVSLRLILCYYYSFRYHFLVSFLDKTNAFKLPVSRLQFRPQNGNTSGITSASHFEKFVQFVQPKKINAIRHSRTNLQMFSLLLLVANSLLHFFSILVQN